jgi:hypothetical protein
MAKSIEDSIQNTDESSQNSTVTRRLSYAIGWAAMLVFTFHACTHMVAAGDTWVAMACGRHFVEHGVSTMEPFSANSHKPGPTPQEVSTWPGWAQWITEKVGIETVKKWHPTGWINQNWLTHVIFYELVPKSSYADGLSFTSNALVYWKFAIYIIAVICVYYTCRLLGVHPALAAIFSSFAMFTGRSFLDVRPAGFSNMLVAVFLLILALVTYRNVLYIWLIVPIAVFWCNVHGGYIYLFIMLVPFIGLHFFICCRKKTTAILYNIVAWPFLFLVLFKAGLTLSTFIFAILVVILDVVLIGYKNHLVSIGWKGVKHSIAAYIIAFIAMVILNPFHLTNLTHTFIISVSESAARWREIHEWQSAFDWGNPVGTAKPFLAMMIIGLRILVVWITSLTLSALMASQHASKQKRKMLEKSSSALVNLPVVITSVLAMLLLTIVEAFLIHDSITAPLTFKTILLWSFMTFSWIFWIGLIIYIFLLTQPNRGYILKPKTDITGEPVIPRIDLALIIIAALTIYMAIRSRRFIPISAIAGCPVIALLIYQFIRWIWASKNLLEQKGFTVTPMPRDLLRYFTLAGTFAVLFFGIWWGLKFKSIYLDPWPNDYKYTSVFMRMTASDAKPFYAMKFIRDNKISGNMFNYWTEGGFVAWGQTPDPKTGKTPLQLFMDGRAQAAYNRETFDNWSIIMAGGRLTYEKLAAAQARGQELTSQDYKEIGQWMSEQLTSCNVWVVLMPSAVFNDPQKPSSYHAIRGLESDPNWRTVFFDDGQKLYINVTTEQGVKLFNGIFNNTTVYPDVFHTNLNLAHNWLYYRPGNEQKKIGLDYAIKAFNERPSPAAMLEILYVASTFDVLSPDIEQFCRGYLSSFTENKAQWALQNGYRLKAESARWACFYLEQMATKQNDKSLEDYYSKIGEQCFIELVKMTGEKNW